MGFYRLNTDGTIQSSSIQLDNTWLDLVGLQTKEDGSYYTYYNTNGTPDLVKEAKQDMDVLIAHFKSLYLGVVNTKLKELDYDSLATVKLWEGDATFGAEAARILNWYKAIIAKNYELLNAGVVLTDAEYLTQIESVVF